MFALSPQSRIVALDLETTGLSATRHRVLELAAVCWQDGEEIGHFQTLVNPGCPIPPNVIRVHGITDHMVADKPHIREVLPAFLGFCELGDVVVAHNSPFDARFIDAECARNGIAPFSQPIVDSCSLARQRLPGCPNYRLDTLKTVLGLGRGVKHRGLEDARDCLGVFLHCLRGELPPVRLPIEPPPLPQALHPLRDALRCGGTVLIEYCDTRGCITKREVRPIHISETMMEAHCLLRNDRRFFTLERIRRATFTETHP